MTKPELTIYHMQGSRSFRVIWLLEELGLPYNTKMIGFDLGNAGGPAYQEIHPLQKVPALVDGKTTMFESIAIMQYVMNRYGDSGLRPSVADEDYASYLQWLHYGESTLAPIIVDLMRQRRFYPKDKRDEHTIEQAENALTKQFAFLTDQLDGHDYILERGFSAADISVGYCLLLARFAGAKKLLPDRVIQYWNSLIERPAWIKASAQSQ